MSLQYKLISFFVLSHTCFEYEGEHWIWISESLLDLGKKILNLSQYSTTESIQLFYIDLNQWIFTESQDSHWWKLELNRRRA